MTYLLTAVAAMCTALICAACFLCGYILGQRGQKPLQRVKGEDTSRQDRQARIKQRQLENFWNYNGDSQQDPAEQAAV